MKNLAGLCVFVLVACGSKKEPPAVKIDAAAVNALVPEPLKAKLEFVEKSVAEERGRSKTIYTLAAPKTWTEGDSKMKMFAKLEPPSSDGFGNFTGFQFGSNCDGKCEEKDWAKVSEKVNFAQFRGKKILKDEVGKTSHLMVVEDGDDTFITYAWWVDGGENYYTCRATLSKGFSSEALDPRAAVPAFEKACQAVNVKNTDD
ncbi:MAG: hypothetical protein M4D80_09750 [Myxococcota bacterium]|nr:hypothetical protein [Deltaproteobacteria bacterium]MDQ3335437.1 hypothetical protein [Myxococcota bacterium]